MPPVPSSYSQTNYFEKQVLGAGSTSPKTFPGARKYVRRQLSFVSAAIVNRRTHRRYQKRLAPLCEPILQQHKPRSQYPQLERIAARKKQSRTPSAQRLTMYHLLAFFLLVVFCIIAETSRCGSEYSGQPIGLKYVFGIVATGVTGATIIFGFYATVVV